MISIIEDNEAALSEICSRFGVERLELFGSACTSEFDREHSDLDFLVEYPAGYDFGPWLSRLFELQAALSQLFGRRVDLLTTSALHNPWLRREAEKTRSVVYYAPKVPQVA